MINFIIQHKYLSFFTPIIVILLLAIGTKNLAFTNDYHIFFSSDNPQLIAFDNLQDTYNKTDSILIGLRDTSGIFTNKNLKAIADITTKAWQTPFSTRVDSLANYQHTFANGDDLLVIDLIDTENELNAGQIDEIASNEVLLKNRLITSQKDTTGINITIQLPNNEKLATKGQDEVVAFARNLRDEIKKDYPQFEVFLSGIVMLNQAFPEAGQEDIKSLIPLAFLIVFVLLFVVLGNIFLVLGSLILLVFAVIGSFGSVGHLGLPITPVMTSLPVIILTIAVAGSVHLMMSFVKKMRNGTDKIKAIKEAFEHNVHAITIAGITTAIGFFGLNFSEVPPFHDLGNAAAIGTLLSLILTLVFLPAWILVLPIKIKTKKIQKTHLMLKFSTFVIRSYKKILVFSLLAVIVFVSFIPLNEINDNFVEYFDERVEFRRDADKVDKYLTGIGSIDYSFKSGEAGGVANPEFLASVEKFTNWARKQSEVNNVSSITDIFKRLNKNMHGDDETYYKLPQNRELSAQYLLLYEMSLPYGLDLNNQINIDKSAIRVSVNMKNMSSKGYLGFENKADNWLKNNTPKIHTSGASPSIMFAHIGLRNVHAMLIGTAITLIVISIILGFILRSFKMGLISLVPNLIPVSMAFGLWALTNGQISMAISVVASITLGIIVDDTVHFLDKFNYGLKTLGRSAKKSVAYAFEHVGHALILSSVALTAGFLVLIGSVFEINSGMGWLTSYVIVIALIMDFLLLPSLLIFFNKSQSKNSKG
ncbi:Predicted exporter of the RND superfamily [uncultured Candidatus Thioglobus sp.]|nr:Predicted exporter of the RND superfamily [uncultured Candidatus Thioglobus sp.]